MGFDLKPFQERVNLFNKIFSINWGNKGRYQLSVKVIKDNIGVLTTHMGEFLTDITALLCHLKSKKNLLSLN